MTEDSGEVSFLSFLRKQESIPIEGTTAWMLDQVQHDKKAQCQCRLFIPAPFLSSLPPLSSFHAPLLSFPPPSCHSHESGNPGDLSSPILDARSGSGMTEDSGDVSFLSFLRKQESIPIEGRTAWIPGRARDDTKQRGEIATSPDGSSQ